MAGRGYGAMMLVAVSAVCLLAAGCGETGYDKPHRSVKPEAFGVDVSAGNLAESGGQASGQPSSEPAPAEKTGSTLPEKAAQHSGPSAAPAASPAQSSTPPVVREKAAAGAGRKGHYKQGLVTTPLSVYWRAQERIAFQVQIPHALQLYKAMNGHYPRTQEEFVKEILVPNGVKLPELPKGHRYVYDPEKGELLVEHPAP